MIGAGKMFRRGRVNTQTANRRTDEPDSWYLSLKQALVSVKPHRSKRGSVARTPSVLLMIELRLVDIAGARRLGLSAFVSQHRLSRKLDLVTFATDALDHDLLSLFELIPYVLHSTVSDLGDVQ